MGRLDSQTEFGQHRGRHDLIRHPSMTSDNSQRNRRTYRRIVVKAGTALIAGRDGTLDVELMSGLVDQIALLQSGGLRMLFVSSGAVAAGRPSLPASVNTRSLPMRQVLAAVGQGRLLSLYRRLFRAHNVEIAQALLTSKDLDDREGYLNVRNTLIGLVDHGVVPIINENDVVAVDELKGEVFGDNDMLSAMVANIVEADLLIMLGEVPGLFTADPNRDPNARLIPDVPAITPQVEALAGPSVDGRGRGGMATKLEAAKLATASGVDAVIADGRAPDAVRRIIAGETLGTYFPHGPTRVESRKRYLLSQMRGAPAVIVDSGAARALVKNNRSLLAAGVVDSEGDFDRGDIVMVVDSNRQQIACGISNYSSEDIRHIRRLHSDHIEHTLGHYFGAEVVHRDNIVILARSDSS